MVSEGSTGPDISEFVAASTRGGSICRIETVRTSLEPDKLASLDAALAKPEITGAAIRRVLGRWGYEVAASTVTRHRRGDCACQG